MGVRRDAKTDGEPLYNGWNRAERSRATRWKHAAGRRGEYLPPIVCSACGQDQGRIFGHWENYDPPFSAAKDIPLCSRCHFMVHSRHRRPEQWDRYRAAIAKGWRPPAVGASDAAVPVESTVDSRPRAWILSPTPPSILVLDRIHDGAYCPAGRVAGYSRSNPSREQPADLEMVR